MNKEEILKELGLDKLPAPRVDAPTGPGGLRGSVKWIQCRDLVDPLETAAFHEFLDPSIVIDQSLDAKTWVKDACFGAAIPWKREIPSNYRIWRSTGIGATPHAKNLYLWLAAVVKAQWDLLNVRAVAPPLVFRTNGHDGTEALLGCLLKFDMRRRAGEGPASLALLSEKKIPKIDPEMAEIL